VISLQQATQDTLAQRDVEAKLSATTQLRAAWQAGSLDMESFSAPIDTAGIPDRPVLADPRTMPKRQLSCPENHAALIHALAHIEFNAINLALDAVQRFPGFPPDYYGDWLKVAAEEAYHFRLLRDHLRGLKTDNGQWDYGSFPAHAGLWELAQKTAHDPLARMALVPRLMEARGLDVTPDIQRKLTGFGDKTGAAILDIILVDEIGHVAAGDRWFRWLCARRGLDAETTYRDLLATPGVPQPRRPFNESARLAAGFSQAELANLSR
jgi:uncharacterized ferritin-like protein (DUF455 family)